MKRWPPTYAIVGSEDFLSLDTMHFMYKLHQLERMVKLDIVMGVPHAFLLLSPIVSEINTAFK